MWILLALIVRPIIFPHDCWDVAYITEVRKFATLQMDCLVESHFGLKV